MTSKRGRHERLTEAAVTAARVKAGTFVSWPASKGESRGKVVSVHSAGKPVPGLPHQLVGTTETPAARVQLYAKEGNGWTPTTVFLGQHVAALSAIEALPEPVEEATESIVSGSFDDIRQRVEDAIADRIESLTGRRVWVYVYDIGFGWAVYRCDDADLMMVDYTLDGETITVGEPVAVCKVTSYVVDESVVVESRERLDEGRLLAALGTDADGNRVFEVMIVQYGLSKNGRLYPEAVMREAAPLYEGAKAYDHHRPDAELNTGTVAGLVGHYRNIEATASGLKGELHVLQSAGHIAEMLDQSLANQAAGLPLLVGISHDVMAASKPVMVDGRQVKECTAIRQVNSADVVSDPAAGGEVMRMVANNGDPNPPTPTPKGTPTMLTFQQLLAQLRSTESANRAALLTEHAAIITAAGFTAEQVTQLIETAPPVAPTQLPTTPPVDHASEAKLTKGTTSARMVVERFVADAHLAENMAEAILAELPTQFTETELAARVESIKRVAEGLEKAGLRPGVPHVQVTADDRDKKVKALDAMFAGNFQEGYRSIKQAYVDFTGVNPYGVGGEDLNRRILRESVGMNIGGHTVEYDSSRSTESVDSGTWTSAFGDSVTRRMVAVYSTLPLQEWRKVVSSIVPLNDFRTQRIDRIGGYGVLPVVPQGAPYQPLTTPTDQEVTYAAAKRGGTEDLTLEAIANDDVRAIVRIPDQLARAAAQTLFRFVFDFFQTNPLIYDAVALFAAGHANTDTNALSGANVSVGRKKMRKQSAYGDTTELLGTTPKYILVNSDLEELAWELCHSAVALPSGAPVGAATNIPNIHQSMEPIVIDYWTSTTAWYLLGDPALIPTMELGFYQGRQDPELFVQNDPSVGSVFNADKVTWKIRHIYSGAWLEYRGAYRGNA